MIFKKNMNFKQCFIKANFYNNSIGCTVNTANLIRCGLRVKVLNFGGIYFAYTTAFNFFGLYKWDILDDAYYVMNDEKNAPDNVWVVMDYALHSFYDKTIIAHLYHEKLRKSIVIMAKCFSVVKTNILSDNIANINKKTFGIVPRELG